MKRFLFGAILLATPNLLAAPIVSPSTPTVFVGGTLQFISTDAVTWSLTSGSTGTINGSGTYFAPPSLPVKSVLEGCMLRPSDDIYNTRIDSLPVDTNSNSRITHLLGGTTFYFTMEETMPHNVYSDQTPVTNEVFKYTPNNNGNYPILPPPYTGVESNLFPTDYFAQDRHILGVDTNTCVFSEIYNNFPAGALAGCPLCTSASGVKYAGSSYQLADTTNGSGGGTDAAGQFIQPLLIHYSELKAGVINHAMRFTMDNGDIQSAFIWPAVANAAVPCTPSANCLPYGARFRLKASFPIASYSPTLQVILKAMQRYGIFMVDGGISGHIQTSADVLKDTITYHAIQNELAFNNVVNQFNMDIVDESSLEVSSATGKVNLVNPYVVPDNYAEVVATKISDGTRTLTRIALIPVTVGSYNVPFPASGEGLSMMAGTPATQIPYWVEGATTTSVTCSMTPTIGSLTSGCLYTPPSSQINISSTVIVTITPTADATNALNLPLTIFPSDGIRINAGGQSSANSPTPSYDANGNFIDHTGNKWWADPTGNGLPWFGRNDSFYPQTTWPSSTTVANIALWYTSDSNGQDGAYSAMVPNGNYTLSMGFGGVNSDVGMANVYQSLDSQGSVLASSTVLKGIIGSTQYVPSTATYTVSVTNNQFYAALRNLGPTQANLVNWMSLIGPIGTPVITSSLTASGQVGVPFSYQIAASSTPFSFSATPLPSGLSVNTGTGLISGTPLSGGITTTTIGATNGNGTGTAPLVITILGAAAAIPSESWSGNIPSMRGTITFQ